MAATRPRGILDLPDEILHGILGHVIYDVRDYQRRVRTPAGYFGRRIAWELSQVCSRFLSLTAHWLFNETFVFGQDLATIHRQLQRMTHSTMLHRAVTRMVMLPKLTLQMSFYEDPIIMYDTLIRFMASCSRLTHLAVGDVTIVRERDGHYTGETYEAWLPERRGQFVFFPDCWEEHVGVVCMPSVRLVKIVDGFLPIDNYGRLFRGNDAASIFPNLEELCLLIWVYQEWDERLADNLIEILKAHPRLRRLRVLLRSHRWQKDSNLDDFIQPMIQPLHKLCSFVPDPVMEGKAQQLEYLCVMVFSLDEYPDPSLSTRMLDRLLEGLDNVAIRGRARRSLAQNHKRKRDEAHPREPTSERRIEDPHGQLRRTGLTIGLIRGRWYAGRGTRMWEQIEDVENKAWDQAASSDGLDLFCPTSTTW